MNILLIQLKRIGDLILTTPAIAAIRAKHPRANISLVVSSDTRDLLPAIRGVDQTFIARKKISDATSWFTVARRSYDYCFDFTRNDRSAFLTLLSGAKNRVTADHPRLRAKLRSLSYNVLVGECSIGTMHTVDYHLCLLQPLGIKDASPTLQLHLPQLALHRADEMLRAAGISGNFVLLHPGSARVEKFWEADRWAEVIRYLHDRGLTTAITGSAAPLEQAHIAEIRARAKHPFVDLSGKGDLLSLAALIQRARLLVTVDSAPMHFAAATQTPQVVLFGPTNPMHWYPRFTPAVILQGHQSQPVTEFSPKQKAVEMNRISTQQVIDAMEALLAAPRAATL
ncbi:MAG: putative lipopolysaccharide heptosyltransferase III [Chthoniobacterales bacterium]